MSESRSKIMAKEHHKRGDVWYDRVQRKSFLQLAIQES